MGRMGTHAIGESKEKVVAEVINWSEMNYDRQETSHGLSGVVWKNYVANSEEEAYEYLNEQCDEKYYWSNMAVGCEFMDLKEQPKLPKKYYDLVERAKVAYRNWTNANRINYFENVKQKTISCKNCGTRLSMDNNCVKTRNLCPVCGKSLRSKTVEEKLIKMYKKYKSYEDEAAKVKEEIIAKKRSNPKNICKMYMVVGKIHC